HTRTEGAGIDRGRGRRRAGTRKRIRNPNPSSRLVAPFSTSSKLLMAEASGKQAAGVTPKGVSSAQSIYLPLLEKVEGMKKTGVPTEETSKLLEGMENRFKTYHMFWEANVRKVRGLQRNGLWWRVHAVIVTAATAAAMVKGSDVADMYIKLFKSAK
ncbi:unnamed protein product, partial [Urochloa humidicola]